MPQFRIFGQDTPPPVNLFSRLIDYIFAIRAKVNIDNGDLITGVPGDATFDVFNEASKSSVILERGSAFLLTKKGQPIACATSEDKGLSKMQAQAMRLPIVWSNNHTGCALRITRYQAHELPYSAYQVQHLSYVQLEQAISRQQALGVDLLPQFTKTDDKEVQEVLDKVLSGNVTVVSQPMGLDTYIDEQHDNVTKMEITYPSNCKITPMSFSEGEHFGLDFIYYPIMKDTFENTLPDTLLCSGYNNRGKVSLWIMSDVLSPDSPKEWQEVDIKTLLKNLLCNVQVAEGQITPMYNTIAHAALATVCADYKPCSESSPRLDGAKLEMLLGLFEKFLSKRLKDDSDNLSVCITILLSCLKEDLEFDQCGYISSGVIKLEELPHPEYPARLTMDSEEARAYKM